jgi:hypothetical protein
MQDGDVRCAIYDLTIRTGSVPSAAGVASEVGTSEHETMEAIRRLATERIVVLDGDRIRMAAPFSGVPTPFVVRAGDRSYYANCIWDALGISPMLKIDSTIETHCPDCAAPLSLSVVNEELFGEGVVHFAVPANRWWQDIVYT